MHCGAGFGRSAEGERRAPGSMAATASGVGKGWGGWAAGCNACEWVRRGCHWSIGAQAPGGVGTRGGLAGPNLLKGCSYIQAKKRGCAALHGQDAAGLAAAGGHNSRVAAGINQQQNAKAWWEGELEKGRGGKGNVRRESLRKEEGHGEQQMLALPRHAAVARCRARKRCRQERAREANI